MIKEFYRGKKVLVTGNTGFKGSWLTVWLLGVGAKVIGVSKDIPTNPSMFQVLNLDSKIEHHEMDVRDLEGVCALVERERPDIVFHLAAQAIVSLSYEDPIETFSTNVMGTANLLEALLRTAHPCSAVIITSDKCYDNVEWVWGYRETDSLGGKDIYSGSKGGAELVFKSYFHSFMKDSPVRIASARAGNVIGGGDWARDRIVVDSMRAWSEGRSVEIRSPKATRPWQHVLEPLSGYLTLAMMLNGSRDLHGSSFNFGPRSEQNRTVVELLGELSQYWDFKSLNDAYTVTGNIPFHEAGLLKLNCDKALHYLKWESNLDFTETIRFVSEWYYNYYRNNIDMYAYTQEQIDKYERLASQRGRVWALA